MLSLCMIVKNEEKYLEGCLDSVKEIVDEIIIVDTGSNDSTKMIAEKYNAKIFDYEWSEDFADARNLSLDNAAGKWILYLDADERLSETSRDLVTGIVRDNNKNAYECRIINIDKVGNRPSVMKYVRLFPKIDGVKFKGKVHEQIEESLVRQGCGIISTDIEIIHLGYSLEENQLKQKAGRNLKILLEEYRNLRTGYVCFQIAQTYHILEDENTAIEFFNKSLEDPSLRKEYKATAFRSIAIADTEKNNYESALRNINKSLQYDTNQPITLMAASKIYLKTGKCNEAVDAAEKAYKLNKELFSGRLSSSQSILADELSIIYNGLYIARKCGKTDAYKKFFELFKQETKLREQTNFLNLFIKLMNSIPLENNELDYIQSYINKDNLELTIELIENIKNVTFNMKFLKKIEPNFRNDTYFINIYALTAAKVQEFNTAEMKLKESLKIDFKNPSTIFYLISVYVQQNKLHDALELITARKDDFKDQPEVLSRFNIVLQKLSQSI